MFKNTYDSYNRLHSYNDQPSSYSNGTYCWHKHGQLHRDNDLPAVISNETHTETWCLNGLVHRVDGPAKVTKWSNGNTLVMEWYQNSIRHRIDGPAVIWEENSYFYLHGRNVTAMIEEYAKLMNFDPYNMTEDDKLLLLIGFGNV